MPELVNALGQGRTGLNLSIILGLGRSGLVKALGAGQP